jgi:epoxide hydrolase-like predicted phosphatase
MIKAIMIDFGGVLVRTEDQRLRRKLESQLSIPAGELAKWVFDSEVSRKALLGLAPESAIWDNIANKFNLDANGMKKLVSDFWKYDLLDEDLLRYLSARRDKYRICILSNAWTGARKLFTDVYHLDQVTDEIIISSEEGITKPDPRIYLLAANRLHLKPEEIVFIDDFPENVEAANQCGMNAIHFIGTKELYKALNIMLD